MIYVRIISLAIFIWLVLNFGAILLNKIGTALTIFIYAGYFILNSYAMNYIKKYWFKIS